MPNIPLFRAYSFPGACSAMLVAICCALDTAGIRLPPLYLVQISLPSFLVVLLVPLVQLSLMGLSRLWLDGIVFVLLLPAELYPVAKNSTQAQLDFSCKSRTVK